MCRTCTNCYRVQLHGLDVQCDQGIIWAGGLGGLVLDGQCCSPHAPLHQVPHCLEGGQNASPVLVVKQPKADLYTNTHTQCCMGHLQHKCRAYSDIGQTIVLSLCSACQYTYEHTIHNVKTFATHSRTVLPILTKLPGMATSRSRNVCLAGSILVRREWTVILCCFWVTDRI